MKGSLRRLGLGVPAITPAVASASVHAAEIFTTAMSGLSHLRFGNVEKGLFRRLVIPGVIGGVLGAYVLTTLPSDVIKPVVALYLMAMGLVILRKALGWGREEAPHLPNRLVVPLGTIGGFFDAIGGGGWGPIVTSTLVARGKHPRFAVGSVNLAEFFVTLAESVTFVLTIGQGLAQMGWVILGLIIGGVMAAPLAAYVCRKLPTRTLMIIVGLVIIVLSLRTICLALA
ncbi:MAG: sulfite exporter TauE/SafE family protein [Anaerolineae bacterium]|nr:sulfite exporter TauE/SafE family protein [Anaerolineae bacterium]